jgi:hypothetical protein
MHSYGLVVLAACALLAAPRIALAEDLSKLDLSGEWYVLLHYKDAKSEDKSITKFKDFAWSIRQQPAKLEIDEYPYVLFDEGTEEIRLADMRGHKPWQPEGLVLDGLLQHVDVSTRAMREKVLEGSTEAGMKSLAPADSSGGGTMSFVRNWDVTWSPALVRISIVDSLSGGSTMLGGMEEASVFEIKERPSPGELRGTWSEGDKAGSLRMIRAKERRVLK